jgi:SAM-dependent methyltransferase
MLRRSINQVALVQSTGNSGNSCNMRASIFMSYTEITFSDKNPIKRWLQHQRLATAVKLCRHLAYQPENICNFGSGNGELCKRLSDRYPNANVTCYEPTPNLLEEARENLHGIENIAFVGNIRSVPCGAFDVVLCLEVFEHLPVEEIKKVLGQISDLLKPGGIIVIGVPVETGIPALYKGLFRMSRRYGAFDAKFRNVSLAFLGRPPGERPLDEITPGFKYHWEHMGFDSRQFEKNLLDYFKLNKLTDGACTFIGSRLMPEAFYVVENANNTIRRSF